PPLGRGNRIADASRGVGFEEVVHRDLLVGDLRAEHDGRAALRVQVADQNTLSTAGEAFRAGQHDGRLAHPAFEIAERDGAGSHVVTLPLVL
ncbi:hypothetical protein PCS70012_02307, partial [Streptococcus pneumoniae PCS70012]